MLNNEQIKLVQTAVRAAGIRTKEFDGRYRMLLANFRNKRGPIESCKDLNMYQLEDLLAICESHGWQHPGKTVDFYRKKREKAGDYASFAQQEAIKHLAGDLGWTDEHLKNFVAKFKAEKQQYPTAKEAYKIIEALKAILSKETGKKYNNLKQIQEEFKEAVTDGKESQIG